jgi:hypothetical protein
MRRCSLIVCCSFLASMCGSLGTSGFSAFAEPQLEFVEEPVLEEEPEFAVAPAMPGGPCESTCRWALCSGITNPILLAECNYTCSVICAPFPWSISRS